MPAMTWVRLYEFSRGAVALVLADTRYDRRKPIRTWDKFIGAVAHFVAKSRLERSISEPEL